MKLRLAVVGSLSLVAALLLPGQSGATEPSDGSGDTGELPVPYSLPIPLALTTLQPDLDPPGANDWECVPTADHPNPVVLVHGGIANKANNWQAVSPLLKNNGYCVFALTYGSLGPYPASQVGAFGKSIEDSSADLAEFVDRVLHATGAEEVDLVGHSFGTLMPQYYLQRLGGAAFVDKYVAATPLYDGFLGVVTPGFDALRALGVFDEFEGAVRTAFPFGFDSQPGSDFLREMHEAPGGPAVPGVTYTTVMTRYDDVVIPYTSGRLDAPNATNIVVQDGCEIDFSDHFSITYTRRTGQIILNALDPAHSKPLPCELALPLIGSQLIPGIR